MILEDFLSHFKNPRKSSNGYECRCPAHDDDKESLSVAERDGKILLHCHAGCDTKSILEVLNLKISDLFVNPNRKSGFTIDKTWDYHDENGRLVYQTVKLIPKQFRQRRPNGNGGWHWNLQGVTPVPYRLPEILKEDGVIIVEGEKDCDSLEALGLIATTNPMGAGKWRPEFNQYFRDKSVVIIPDNDEPGRLHSENIFENLKGYARKVQIVDLPNLPPKGDVTDWLSNGGSKEALLDLMASQPSTEQEEPLRFDIATDELQAVPQEILLPGGILQNIMEYIEDNSVVSVPIFNMAAAITLLGSVCGQKIMTESRLRTNLYSVCLGYSGSGKNAALETLPELLAHSACNKINGDNTFTSGSALLRSLSKEDKRVQLFWIDEIGHKIQRMNRPNSAVADVPEILTELWSATRRSFTKSYASQDPITVPWHHLSILGASTPRRFWESLTVERINDGFIARFIVWESHHRTIPPKDIQEFNISSDLIAALDALWRIETITDETRGNLVQVPKPHMIRKTKEAEELFKKWALSYFALHEEYSKLEDGIGAIYGRAAENAHKLALIHAVSMHGASIISKKVDVDSVIWATKTIDYIVPNMVNQLKLNVAVNEVDAWGKQIIRTIRNISTPNRPGASEREIIRATPGLYVQNVEQILHTLERAGRVSSFSHKPKRGREVTLYGVVKDDQK